MKIVWLHHWLQIASFSVYSYQWGSAKNSLAMEINILEQS